MKMQSTPYIEESERRVLIGAISRLAQEMHAYRVSFDPPADGLLLQSERAEDYLTFHPIFSDEKPDLLVFHLSPHWRDCEAEQATRIQENMKRERPLYVFEEESKPRWLIWKR